MDNHTIYQDYQTEYYGVAKLILCNVGSEHFSERQLVECVNLSKVNLSKVKLAAATCQSKTTCG